MSKYQIIVAVIAASAGFLYGYDIAIIKMVFIMDAFRINFGLATWDGKYRDEDGTVINYLNSAATPRYRYLQETDDNNFIEGIITTGYIFGAICGAYMSSFLSDKYGRKKAMIICGLVFSFGAITQVFTSYSYVALSFGRFIMGFAIGSFTVICPVYISELAPAKIRGEISYSYYAFVVLGVVTSSIINTAILYTRNIKNKKTDVIRNNPSEPIDNLEWKLAFMIQSLFGFLFTSIMFIIPKSPRWLCYSERNVEALHIMSKIYNKPIDDALLQEKVESIQNDAIINRAIGHSDYSELFIPSVRRRTFNIIFMFIIQQWTGIAIYMLYETRIFTGASFTEYETVIILPVIGIFILGLFSLFMGFTLIDRYGRKYLLMIGALILFFFNMANTLGFPYPPKESRILKSTPLFSSVDNCNELKKSPPYYHDNALNIDFFNNECHTNQFICHTTQHRISWDGDNKSFAKNNITNYRKKMNEICDIEDSMNLSRGTFYMKASIFLFLCVYLATWGPVSFISKAEIFPIRIRSKGSAVGTITQSLNNLIILTVGPSLFELFDLRLFIVFTVDCFIGSVFAVVFCVQPTGIPLERMEEKLSGKVIEGMNNNHNDDNNNNNNNNNNDNNNNRNHNSIEFDDDDEIRFV